MTHFCYRDGLLSAYLEKTRVKRRPLRKIFIIEKNPRSSSEPHILYVHEKNEKEDPVSVDDISSLVANDAIVKT